MEKTALIVDGHNYLFRAFFGVPSSAKTPKGIQVNAVYGFFSFLRRVVQKIHPDHIIVIFDSETGITQKKILQPHYKSNRKEIDGNIFDQLNIIKSILSCMKIKYVEHPDFEADDVIGTVASSWSKKVASYISSNDLDFCQLIKFNLYVVRDAQGKLTVYDSKVVKQKFGIETYQYLDYLTLTGDKSDNIKGVNGIGPKTAASLLNSLGKLENILDETNKLSLRIKLSIDTQKHELLENRDFFKISTDLQINHNIVNMDIFDKKSLMLPTNSFLKNLGIYDD